MVVPDSPMITRQHYSKKPPVPFRLVLPYEKMVRYLGQVLLLLVEDELLQLVPRVVELALVAIGTVGDVRVEGTQLPERGARGVQVVLGQRPERGVVVGDAGPRVSDDGGEGVPGVGMDDRFWGRTMDGWMDDGWTTVSGEVGMDGR